MTAVLEEVRAEWVRDGVVCHFCGGPAFAWLTDDETWAQVEPLLGQNQACAVCFLAARQALGLATGEPVRIVQPESLRALAVLVRALDDGRMLLRNEGSLVLEMSPPPELDSWLWSTDAAMLLDQDDWEAVRRLA